MQIILAIGNCLLHIPRGSSRFLARSRRLYDWGILGLASGSRDAADRHQFFDSSGISVRTFLLTGYVAMAAVTEHEWTDKQETSAWVQASVERVYDREYSRDAADLARFGKRQQLKRNFALVSTVGFTCTFMITWEGFATVFQTGLANGGPSGLVYGYLFTWIGTVFQGLVMAELASMIPIAGGQYNWVAIISPPSCSKFLSYLTGWITLIFWQASLASGAFLGGTLIQGLLILNYDSYNPQRWHGTLLFYAVLAVSLLVNTYLARMLPTIESTILVLHILGFFGILITLVYFAPHQSPGDVFANFQFSSGWDSDGLSFLVGLTTSMFAFIGADAPAHIAEEIENASSVIPRSMFYSIMIDGALGFAMCITLLFCLGDLDAALNSPTGYPFIEIFTSAVGSNLGGTLMTCVIICAMISAAIAALASASRMTWAFARENGLPLSKYISKVDPRTSLPLYSIGLSAAISMALALINIGSTVAFNALISLVIASFYSSFVISAFLMLYKRLTVPDHKITWGRFKLGRAGVPITVIAILFSLIGIFFSFWPPTPTFTLNLMNWSVVVYSGSLFIALAFWLLYGRHVYTGPISEISLEGEAA